MPAENSQPLAGSSIAVELPALTYDQNVTLPEYTDQAPGAIWRPFFKQYRPEPQVVADLVLKLTAAKEHEHAIGCMQAALIHGQAQPWMYELLAVEMEHAGRPQEEIERVVLSLSDFGTVDYGSVMYSGAFLSNFQRHAAALKMYQQAARMLPERPEPYVLGLKQALTLNSAVDITWAAQGILENYWDHDYAARHREARIAVAEAQRKLRQAGQAQLAEELGNQLAAASIRDLVVRVEWSGAADLDLSVTEPAGTICAFQTPETTGGGIHTHDGTGPTAATCFEEYVCPTGYAGEYRLTVHHQGGALVGQRATVIVRQGVGTMHEQTEQHTISLKDGDATVRIELQQGRRKQPRTVIGLNSLNIDETGMVAIPARRRVDPQAANSAIEEFNDSRINAAAQRRGGAFGFAPVVQVLNDGSSLQAQGVVSADRRYVRLAINPSFSTITDVFTYSILGGQTTRQGNGNP